MCGDVCSYMWVDNDTIGAVVIPPGRGQPPEKPLVPIGPNIQDNTSGKTSQVIPSRKAKQPAKQMLIQVTTALLEELTCPVPNQLQAVKDGSSQAERRKT